MKFKGIPQDSFYGFSLQRLEKNLKNKKSAKWKQNDNDHRPYGERPPQSARSKLTEVDKKIMNVPFIDFREI